MKTSSESLRVGLVSDDSLDGHHGVGAYVRDVGAWLDERGHDVHYIVGETHNPPATGTTHQLASRQYGVRFNGNRLSIPHPLSQNTAQDFLAKMRFDVLHVQLPYAPWHAGRLVAAVTTEHLVGTFHILPFDTKARLGAWAVGRTQQNTLKKFAHATAPSEASADFATWGYKIHPEVVGNPVDTHFFRDAEPLPEYQDGRFNIVYIGRLVERKGVQHALEALQRLNHEGESLRFIIGGDGPLRAELQDQAQKLNNIEVVFEKTVDNERKRRLLKSAEIALFPATSGESFGIVLTEAMAAERPIVLGGNNPGYKSVLDDAEIATQLSATFNPEDHEAFAKMLQFYIHNEDSRRQLRIHQTASVSQYDIDMIGRRLLELYQS